MPNDKNFDEWWVASYYDRITKNNADPDLDYKLVAASAFFAGREYERSVLKSRMKEMVKELNNES